MPSYKMTYPYPRFYPDVRDADGKSLMAEPGQVYELATPPDDGNWVQVDEAPQTLSVVAVPSVAPIGPEPAPEPPAPEPAPVAEPPAPEPVEPVSEPPAPEPEPEPEPVTPAPVHVVSEPPAPDPATLAPVQPPAPEPEPPAAEPVAELPGELDDAPQEVRDWFARFNPAAYHR